MTNDAYQIYCDERNRKFREKHGRDMAYDDVLRPLGQSQDTGRRDDGSQDNGIVEQT